MKENGLKVKDLVNIGVFSALYMIVSIIIMMPMALAPILWLLWPAIAGVFTGTIYMLLMAKVPKKGAAFLLGMITAFIYLGIGECTWTILLSFAAAGIAAEIIRGALGYKSQMSIILSCGALTAGFIGSPLPMWLFQKSYMESIIEMGMNEAYVYELQSLISPLSFIEFILIAFVGGVIGALIGSKMLRKHFEKAGIV